MPCRCSCDLLCYLHLLLLVVLFVGNQAFGEQEVIPSNQFLDVGGIDALAVPLGQCFAHEVAQLLCRSLSAYALFAISQLIDVRHHMAQLYVSVHGVHRYLLKGTYACCAVYGGSLAVDQALNNYHVVTLRHQFEQTTLACY